jgi:hypothetical protein
MHDRRACRISQDGTRHGYASQDHEVFLTAPSSPRNRFGPVKIIDKDETDRFIRAARRPPRHCEAADTTADPFEIAEQQRTTKKAPRFPAELLSI